MVAEILLAKRNVVGTTDDTDALFKASKLALLINCSVWVEIFGDKATSILNVFEGMRGEATFATVIIKSTSAINKLLLTEISELAILLHEMRLHASNCGESPA